MPHDKEIHGCAPGTMVPAPNDSRSTGLFGSGYAGLGIGDVRRLDAGRLSAKLLPRLLWYLTEVAVNRRDYRRPDDGAN